MFVGASLQHHTSKVYCELRSGVRTLGAERLGCGNGVLPREPLETEIGEVESDAGHPSSRMDRATLSKRAAGRRAD